MPQIEGFKLHVTHMIKPFVNRIRYTPEVASRPERLEKDLGNAKKLAAILEDEAARLRAIKVQPAGSVVKKEEDGDDVPVEDNEGDASMASASLNEAEEGPEEPKERGSDAVERRIEKVMSELRDQGLVDVNDEQAYEERKVRFRISFGCWCAYVAF